MAKSVYTETTIPSYLAAWPARDLLQAARQQLTHDWWNNERQKYELCTSQIVLDECAAGDPSAAARRSPFIQKLPLLETTNESKTVAQEIMDTGLIPPRAAGDAVQIALATVLEVHFLLTWNCRHIANAHIIKELKETVERAGFELPVICTPEELLGG